jgi:hypothetical protein
MRITVYKSTLYCELWGSQQRCSGIWRHVDWWIFRRFRRNPQWSSYSRKRQQIPPKYRLLFRNRHGSVSQKTAAFNIHNHYLCVCVRTSIIYIGLIKGRARRWAKHAAHMAYLLQASVLKDCGCEIFPVVSHTKFGNLRASLLCVV